MRRLFGAMLFASTCFSMAAAQQVRLAKVGLGMSEAEVKQALSTSNPRYTERVSTAASINTLLAVTEEESFLFSLVEDRVVAFSLVHLIPAGQQPFLPARQEPTVSILRGLVIKQTWAPAEVNAGDTFWLSDAQGAPLARDGKCDLRGRAVWKAFTVSGIHGVKSAEGLMAPVVTGYPAACGVSVHLNESPAQTEDSRVSRVQIQVVDLKAMTALATGKH